MSAFGKYLLAKPQNAITIAFLCALLPVFLIPTGFVAVIITALITMRYGYKAGFWLLAWVALPSIAMLVLRKTGPYDLVVFRCFLIWLFAGIAYYTRHWRFVLAGMLLVGVVVTVAVHVCYPQVNDWWKFTLTNYVQHTLQQAHWHINLTADDIARQIGLVSPVATGLMVFFVSLTLLIEMFIAALWLQVTMGVSKIDRFSKIRSGYVIALLPCLLGVFIYFKQGWALDLLPVALFPLCVSGLSLLHYFASVKKVFVFFLLVTYLGIIFIPVMVVAMLAVIAFIDAVVHFRKRVI